MSLHDPQPNFVEHDAFLFALLGLISFDNKFLALLDSNPAHAGCPAILDDSATKDSVACDDVLFATLGLMSLDTKFKTTLLEWAIGRASCRERV